MVLLFEVRSEEQALRVPNTDPHPTSTDYCVTLLFIEARKNRMVDELWSDGNSGGMRLERSDARQLLMVCSSESVFVSRHPRYESYAHSRK